MSITTKLLAGSIFLAVTLMSGFWVTKSRKPYNTALFTLHKLNALATVVFFIILVVHLNQAGAAIHGTILLTVLLSGICFVALFVSGALLSLEREFTILVLRIHQVTPVLGVLFSVISLYLMILQTG